MPHRRLPGGLSLNASTRAISGTPTTVAGPLNLNVEVKDSHALVADVVLGLTVTLQLTSATVYSYIVATGGYDASGNVTKFTDSIMGAWSLGYDTLSRLESATVSPAVVGNSSFCWSYDSFGNRTAQYGSNESISGGGSAVCQVQSGSGISVTSSLATYTTGPYANTNRLSSAPNAAGGPLYDTSGDVLNNGVNQYLYNGDGQICAMQITLTGAMTGYLYDASGRRVGKGSITSMSCNPKANGFTLTESYVLGQSGEQLDRLFPQKKPT